MMDDKDRDEAKKLCERLDWMKINGKNDLVQWENVLSYEIARIHAEAVAAERERCIASAIEALILIDKSALSLGKKITTVYGKMFPPEMQMEKAIEIMKSAILQGTEPAKDHDHNTILAIKKLQEALSSFVDDDVACEDPVYSRGGDDQVFECEEAGKTRKEWCAVCHARAVLGETEQLIKELESNG